MKIRNACFFLLLLIFGSCAEYTPKPMGYPYIEKINISSSLYKNDKISFQLSEAATIDIASTSHKEDLWFNIVYPQYKATIFCTYLPVDKNTVRKALADSYQLAFSQGMKANGIQQTLYTNGDHNTSGIIYDIKGQVASPIQFFLTDSVSNFFRGSLYYDEKVNLDSVSIVTEYLREDVVLLLESLQWTRKTKK